MEDVQAIIIRVVIFLAIAQLSHTAPQDARSIAASEDLKDRLPLSHIIEEEKNDAQFHSVEKRHSQVFDVAPMFLQNCNQIYNLDIGDSAVFFSEDGIGRRRCRYRFKSPTGTQLAVQCPQFRLPLGCKREKLIFNQKNYTKLEFCGNKRPKGIVSSANELSVIYFKKSFKKSKKKSARILQSQPTHFACTTQVIGGLSTKPTTTATTTTTSTTTTTTPPTTPTTITTTTPITTTTTTTTTATSTTTESTSTTRLSTLSSTTSSSSNNITDAPSGWFYMEGEYTGWYHEDWGQFPNWNPGQSNVPPAPGWFHHSGENPGWYWEGWGKPSWNETNWSLPTWNWNNQRLSSQSTSTTIQSSTSNTKEGSSPDVESSEMQTSDSQDSRTSWGYWVVVTDSPGKEVKGGYSWVGTGTPKPTSPSP